MLAQFCAHTLQHLEDPDPNATRVIPITLSITDVAMTGLAPNRGKCGQLPRQSIEAHG